MDVSQNWVFDAGHDCKEDAGTKNQVSAKVRNRRLEYLHSAADHQSERVRVVSRGCGRGWNGGTARASYGLEVCHGLSRLTNAIWKPEERAVCRD